MVGLGLICQQLVFAARPEYLGVIYHYMSNCPKYKGTTCLHIPTTLLCELKKNLLIEFLLTVISKGSMENAGTENGGTGKCQYCKCRYWKMPVLENAGTGKSQYWKMPVLENAGTGKCRYWKMLVLKMPVLENDCTGRCRYWKITVLENAGTGKASTVN